VRPAERLLVLAAGLAAALPIVVSTIRVVTDGWVPFADDALIATSALDVLTADSPLLGPWSSGYSEITGHNTFHPGPLLFWLLAVPARAFGQGGLEVTIAAVNVACVLGVVALAHRRGGRPLMLATAVAAGLMLASLPAESYSDIWNPSAPLLPFTLLLFLAWSLASGEHRLLPLTVLVASFLPQCHLGFLVPAAGAFAVGVGGLAVSRRWRPGAPPLRAWLVAAAVVGVVCWSAPLIDQVVNRPGNGVLVLRAATTGQATVGFDSAWRAVVHTVGIPPWWLREPQAGLERTVDLTTSPGAVRVLSAAAVLVALALLAATGWRRRRPDALAAGALGLVLSAAVLVVVRSTPEGSAATLVYSLRWTSPAGMWVWLVLGWSLATLLPPLPRPGPRAARALSAAGLVAAVAVGAVVAADGRLKPEPYDEVRAVADRLDAALREGDGVRVDVSSSPDGSFMALGFGSAVVYALRRDGRTVTAPTYASYLGPEYGAGASEPSERIVHVAVDSAPPAGAGTIARMTLVDHPDPEGPPAGRPPPRRALAVTLAR
jgi:hypothetical protein